MKPSLFFLLILVAFSACTQQRDPCLQPRTASLRAGAYRQADTGTAILDTLLPSPVLIPIDADTNVLLYGIQISKFSFFMSPMQDSCSWVLKTDTATLVNDTLTFYYQRQLHFISNACGYTYFYLLDSVHCSNYSIDSVKLTNATTVTTNATDENLRIYF